MAIQKMYIALLVITVLVVVGYIVWKKYFAGWKKVSKVSDLSAGTGSAMVSDVALKYRILKKGLKKTIKTNVGNLDATAVMQVDCSLNGGVNASTGGWWFSVPGWHILGIKEMESYSYDAPGAASKMGISYQKFEIPGQLKASKKTKDGAYQLYKLSFKGTFYVSPA